MSTPLRTLILEHHSAEAERMVLHLERAGFDLRWQRVETERDFTAALGPEVELILADYQLPHYDALRALARVRESALEAPFLIVSASLGEEIAVAAMQQGAADFVIKDCMGRLGPAVHRALEQRGTRAALRQVEELYCRIATAANELARVMPHYEQLSILAHELAVTPEQIAAVEAADAPLREYLGSKLGELLGAFRQFATPHGPVLANGLRKPLCSSALLTAVQDAVRVLEQTKRSFKSRALGNLRERLDAVLRAQQ